MVKEPLFNASDKNRRFVPYKKYGKSYAKRPQQLLYLGFILEVSS